MAKQKDKPEKKKTTSHKGTRLTEERIKLIASNYIANGCNNKTKALVDAGYTYKTARYRGTALIADKRVQAEIKKQMQPVIATGQITLINLQTKLNAIADKIIATDDPKLFPTAISAINSLLKTIGGFQADRQPPENIAAKLLDAKKAEELNKALNAYYSSKYLACNPEVITVESTCKDTDSQQFTDALQADSASFEPDETIEEEFTGQEAITPHDPGASTPHSIDE